MTQTTKSDNDTDRDGEMMTDGGVVPSKYQPEPRQYEDKEYLQQKYWGELMSVREIADENAVCHDTIRKRMQRHGIPVRVDGYSRQNSVSPFTGFYAGAPAPTDEESRTRYDDDAEYQQQSTTDDDGAFRWGVVDHNGDRR